MSLAKSKPGFAERLDAGAFAVTLEITPPQKPLPDVLGRRARMLGDAAQAVNVIERPGRMSSLNASISLAAMGLDPVWHVANRGRSRSDLEAEILHAKRHEIRMALCVRGDHEAADRADTPKLRELLAMVAAELPGALLGATANQFGPRERVLRNLLPKLESGASFVQTQPVFVWEPFETLAVAIKERAPETKIVPMVMPLLSSDAADAVSTRLGLPVDDGLRSELRSEGEAAGWRRFAELLERLSASELADGVAIMTREMDPPVAVTGRIARCLRALQP